MSRSASRSKRPPTSLVSVVLACAACAPHPPPAPVPTTPALELCAVRLPTPDLSSRKPAPPVELPLSSLVAKVTFDVASLTGRLSQEIPPRVASARDVDAGAAGKLSYDIDRSAFGVSLHGDRLQVATQLTAHAQLCKPLGILGCVPYGGCDPAAYAVASVPLTLRPDYGIGPASVSISVTRPCLITTLSLDATPRIQSGANQQARRIRSRINALLPSFESGARALWSAMGVVVPLGLQTRLRIVPEQVVQGAPTMSDHKVSIPLGVRGRLRVESRESAPDNAPAFPPPLVEPSLAPGVSLDVPVEIDLESASASLSRTMPSSPIDAGAEKVTVIAVRLQSDAQGVLLVASLSGRSCGEVAFLATPIFDERAGRVRLADVRALEDPPSRDVSASPRLDLGAVARAIELHTSIELPIDVSTVPRGLERAVGLVRSSSGPDVIVRTNGTHVGQVMPTPDGIAVIVEVRGTADVVVR